MTTITLEREAPVQAREVETNPYPGLRPFEESESRLFFGREREVETILTLLEQQQLVVVHGASGCGKSSVVRAGVVPVFRLDALANDTEARVIIIRPADAGGPISSLARKLEREFPRAATNGPAGAREDGGNHGGAVQSWSELLTTSPDWRDEIGRAASAAGKTLCLIIDQFEEMFALHRVGHAAEVHRVIEFLIELDEPAPAGTVLGQRPLSVILTMRSDYLGHCALWDGFAEAVNRCQYLLPKVSALGLLRSIHEPARLFNGRVTEGVADRLVPLMSREIDGLPILQHALMRSWTVADTEDGESVVGVEELEEVGGVDQALSLHAEQAFKRATGGDPARVDAANCIFRALSALDSDQRIIRRLVSLADLMNETGVDRETITSILDVFRAPEFSLVTPYLSDRLEDGSIVTVSHEALLRQWHRIGDRTHESGRPVGLVYREAQDGLIVTSLSVMARDFAATGSGVLSAAAAETRLPWFREIEERPGWITRYPLERGAEPRGQAEEQWGNLVVFMRASEENLEVERNRLRAEQEMVTDLRLSQGKLRSLTKVIAFLLVFVFILSGVLLYQTIQAKRRAETRLLSWQLPLANVIAMRHCVGRGEAASPGSPCLDETSKAYLKRMKNMKVENLGRSNTTDLQFSPYSGGVLPGARREQTEASK